MISKSYGKKRAAFQKQRSGRRQDWQEAGLDEGFWERICFFMDKFSMTGWHLQSGKQALQSRTESEYKKEADIPSEYVSLDFILYFILSSPALHFRSFLLTCIFFPLFFFLHCTTKYLAVSVLSLHCAPPPPLSTPTQIFLSFSASPYNISFCNPAVSLSVFFFHLLCVKSYRVHSSGSLMPVPLCWLHWHKLIFFPLLLQCHWQWHCRLDCVRLSKWIKLTV